MAIEQFHPTATLARPAPASPVCTALKHTALRYDWVLFDADDTLFHFDAFAGLKRMFSAFAVVFTEADYRAYQAINKPLWVAYQNGSITASQLSHRRFQVWADRLQVEPQALNKAFLEAMAEVCVPMEGAVDLLRALAGNAKMGIITNGFSDLHHTRLERNGLRGYFDIVVISEQVGVAKPHRRIFDHAVALMGNPNRERVLMVGDTPESDILGGIGAGLDTCWLNVTNRPPPPGIEPTYHVASLSELQALLFSGAGQGHELAC